MRRTKSNPEWADDILHRFCDSIKRAAKKHNLPSPILDSECRIEDRSELGEGVYGVVWSTEASDCAFKLSTDSSEAHFIQTAINLRKKGIADPPGIVDYRAIFSLPVKHDGLNVFAIWREQATHVGLPCKINDSDTEMIDFVSTLEKFYGSSDLAFTLAFAEQKERKGDMKGYFDWMEERVRLANQIIDGHKPDAESTFAKLLARCYKLAIKIEESGDAGRNVGNALRVYFEHGILLCDVHGDNVGVVDRSTCTQSWVISDPGHSLILTKSLYDVEIPMLKE